MRLLQRIGFVLVVLSLKHTNNFAQLLLLPRRNTFPKKPYKGKNSSAGRIIEAEQKEVKMRDRYL